ncbi:hypothetical protein CMV_006404 [Castanea mollissima]|uniref:Uncharacterized protein n=1 Tax=Castanea mollissima TaxID=60419 RepID=A0A8J4RAU5_9ROSI|nr:hypothetical protein CMV_006404 [Castanea mollissima]
MIAFRDSGLTLVSFKKLVIVFLRIFRGRRNSVIHKVDKVIADMSTSEILMARDLLLQLISLYGILQDELELTSRVLGRKGGYSGTVVLIKNKATGELIAEGRHSLFD